MYNWRILLGGAASAAILTVGIAAPALAQSVSRADTPSLNGIAQAIGGSTATGVLCDLPGIPMAGPEASAAAGEAGAPCGSAASTQDSSTQDSSPIAGVNGPASDLNTSSSLPGLNSVSGSIPDLSSATGVVPGTANLTGSLPQVSSVAGATQGATAGNVGSGSSLFPGTSDSSSSGTSDSGTSGSSSSSGSSDSGSSSGTTGLGSVTGTVNNITGNLPGGNSVTGDLGGQGAQGS